ncbi:hypothetical protein [Arthrobacter sp. AZCC_0090]|uniref:hypothetical protein n=1 Tax=Arthrobacter sp. AZCC_0090 TaxID=2735881 RepID=UPI0016143C73|nr:hypothetical protein [Arthrobacter sp. AZCC_0090]MBB6406191.1 hypothetical protein [Arthrobacter sp. AZCC_0090]
MTDALGGSQITINVAHLSEEVSGPLMYLLQEQNLGAVLGTQVLSLLPDPKSWRLTITGDIVKTVNEIENRDPDNAYTTDRGAGHVGARTITHPDDTSDIIISDDVFFNSPETANSIQDVIEHALVAGAHIALHEAGHAALHHRGEDCSVYQDLPQREPTHYAWRKHLAAHIDDDRIEQLTAQRAPSPHSQESHLEDAIAHFRDELNESKRTWQSDLGSAMFRTLTAANSLIRVIAYLTAELGVDEEGSPVRPSNLPEGWNEYIEHSWDEWSQTFHELKPADHPMTAAEIAAILAKLCELTDRWLRSIGVQYLMTSTQDQSIYWTEDRY